MTLTSLLPQAAAVSSGTGLDGLAVVKEVLGALDQWVRVHEEETTKRTLIAARERVLVEEIRARRELFLTYLDRSFDERSRTFSELFRALDAAADKDPAAIASVLQAINSLAASSPFADLSDVALVRQRLDDAEHVWTV